MALEEIKAIKVTCDKCEEEIYNKQATVYEVVPTIAPEDVRHYCRPCMTEIIEDELLDLYRNYTIHRMLRAGYDPE